MQQLNNHQIIKMWRKSSTNILCMSFAVSSSNQYREAQSFVTESLKYFVIKNV